MLGLEKLTGRMKAAFGISGGLKEQTPFQRADNVVNDVIGSVTGCEPLYGEKDKTFCGRRYTVLDGSSKGLSVDVKMDGSITVLSADGKIAMPVRPDSATSMQIDIKGGIALGKPISIPAQGPMMELVDALSQQQANAQQHLIRARQIAAGKQ